MRTQPWTESVIRNRHVMEPIPTDMVARLKPLADVQAVVFDVYGTLLISGSGDVGSANLQSQDEQIRQSLAAVGISATPPLGGDDLRRQIQQMNDLRRSSECPQPEVDIVQAWRQVLQQADLDFTTEQSVRVACEFESRSNPTWPMPGAQQLLAELSETPLRLGIVSNAQVFTITLLEDLLRDGDLAQRGFDLELCVFSNRFRQAKPGSRLFDVLRSGLARRGIQPAAAVYVGNDMLNDVWAAAQAGFKTAWFAGDARSCRRREQDPRCRALEPDVVLTDLLQLSECLGLE